jgi:hypothetical protein
MVRISGQCLDSADLPTVRGNVQIGSNSAPGPSAVAAAVITRGRAETDRELLRMSLLFLLFIPSKDRGDKPIDQPFWVDAALKVLGTLFGGATAFPQGRGIWRDDAQGGKLLFDEPLVNQCYTSAHMLEQHEAIGRVSPPYGPGGPPRCHRPGDRSRLPGDRVTAGGNHDPAVNETQETEVIEHGQKHQEDCQRS